MEKNKKQALILSIVAVVTLIALVVGATYAYFKAQGGTGSSTEVKVTTYTTDMLTFTTGSAISLYADQSSFGQEKGSLSGETFAKATLVANNKTNEATDNYYVYFNIENNTFKYTLGEDKPELILTVTGPDGNEVTEISGLTHKVVQDRENKSISGFDVTTTNGIITIANKKTITASPNAEEQYTLKLTFVNYEGDQTENAKSTLSAKVMIQKEPIVKTLANICKNGQSLSSCIVAMDGIDETLYHHDATLTNGAGDNSYRYAGGDAHPDYYSCKYKGTDVKNESSMAEMESMHKKGECANVYKLTIPNENPIYVDSSVVTGKKGVKWDSANNKCVTIDGDDVESYTTLTEETCKGNAYFLYHESYLLGNVEEVGSGVETFVEPADDGVKNFVCFGSNASPCPTDNLYRIIGVFGDKVKLIKSDYATSTLLGADGDYSQAYTATGYASSNYKGNNLANIAGYSWNKTGQNTWSLSNLNQTNLNQNFITNIGADWAAKIAETTWKIGGNTFAKIRDAVPSVAYQNEIVSPVTTNSQDNATELNAKVGLMYASDYMYAVPQDKWTLVGYNSDASKDYRAATRINWMYMGLYEWTISRNADYSDSAFYVFVTGNVDGDGRVGNRIVDDFFAVRPVFYLSSSVTYVEGDGTQSSPIRVN